MGKDGGGARLTTVNSGHTTIEKSGRSRTKDSRFEITGLVITTKNFL